MYAYNLRDIYMQSLQYKFHLYTTCKSDLKKSNITFFPNTFGANILEKDRDGLQY
jgi:hypothetical protein